MDSPRQEQLIKFGASLDDRGVPLSFGNDDVALTAVETGVALWDCCHWGFLSLGGGDRHRFLHNQSTNDFYRLTAGQGCDTVLITSTARTLDLATAYVLEEEIWLQVSPGQLETLIPFFDRYIFRADQVTLTDQTGAIARFQLLGPQSTALLEELGGLGAIALDQWGDHQVISLGGLEVRVVLGTGLALPGYTLMTPSALAPQLWRRLVDGGAVPLGERPWEHLRIVQGRPLPGKELTSDYNPLEAGLWRMISFDKGCYIGQETIARLETYQGVKQQLWGVALDSWIEVPTPILVGEEKVGMVTSVTPMGQGALGLAYIRTKAGGAGLKVTAGTAQGQVVDVPFVDHGRP